MNLIEKFMITAKIAVTRPAVIAREIELNEVCKNFWLKKEDLLSKAHKASSVIGKIKPTKSGIKQIKNSNDDFSLGSLTAFSDVNEESLEVKAALSREFLSRIKNKLTIKRSIEANCIAVCRSYIPCQVLKIPVVKVWIAK